VVGDLGVRRERIAGMRVAVAGPVGHSVRRMDILALLNWTIPELARVLPEIPPRLTIFSAGDPMWRGGLSAPQSLFIHSDRPLISENATSTLLHEIVHLAFALKARDGYDWLVEGLAEYYSLELLYRSGTISSARHEQARSELADWAKSATDLCGRTSSGATTAMAVGIIAALDQEIRDKSAGDHDIDDVARGLWKLDSDVDLHDLTEVAEQIVGDKLDTLHINNLPGCRNIATGS
jgi:predicted metalloprotease with PDZ domain